MECFDWHLHYSGLTAAQWRQWRSAGLAGAVGCTARHAEWKMPPEPGKFDGLRFAWGIHPWFAAEWNEAAARELESALADNPALQVGEIGLDYSRESPAAAFAPALQCAAFEAQMALAAEFGRCAVVHVRKAWPDFLAVARQCRSCAVVLHGFSGSAEVARQLMECLPLCRFSFGATLCNRNAARLRRTAAAIPPERFLTDSDWPNRPAFTPPDCRKIGECYCSLRNAAALPTES